MKMKKFFRETRTGGMLGVKRRSQLKIGIFAICALFGIALMAFAVTESTGNANALSTLAIAPLAGTALIAKAKKEEDMTDEEKALIGTIQKSFNDLVVDVTKDKVSKEELEKKLADIKEQIEKAKGDDSTSEFQSKLKSAEDAISLTDKTVKSLIDEIAKMKKEGSFNMGESEFEKSVKAAFESERFRMFANGTAGKSTGQFDIDLKSGVKKDVSMSGNYSGTVLPAYQSDVVVPEVIFRKLRIRDFMRVVDASNDEFTSYYFMEIYDIDRAAVAVTENGTLPEGSFKVREGHAETHRIGWYMIISKRMLRKLKVLLQRINALMPSGMYRAENFQLLYGDNTDPNFKGLLQNCETESVLTGNVYAEAIAGSVKSISSYNGGTATQIEFLKPMAKMETGMKVVFSGFAVATALNNVDGFEINVVNDHTIVVNSAFVAESDASVQANVKYSISNVWGGLIPNANYGDAIRVAIAYKTFAQYSPNLMVMSPITLTTLMGEKDLTGRNLSSEFVKVVNGIPYFDGIIPIAQFDCLPKGKVLIGDFANACELFDTQKGYLEFAEDVQTKLANQVATIIQEEVIFAITCHEAFIYIDLETVKTSVNVPVVNTFNVNSTIVSPLDSDGYVAIKSM